MMTTMPPNKFNSGVELPFSHTNHDDLCYHPRPPS
jgi:hypothetical protein